MKYLILIRGSSCNGGGAISLDLRIRLRGTLEAGTRKESLRRATIVLPRENPINHSIFFVTLKRVTDSLITMKVNTVKVVDPRIDPQPDPSYAVTISPKQNQYYKLPASGLSDSYITFNNIVTLGADRAYSDSMELEITVSTTLHVNNTSAESKQLPDWGCILLDSFPFNRCCDEVKVNINGGAFFSQPLCYLHAKERYWDDEKLNKAYGNVCPCNKPWTMNESGNMQSQNHTIHHTPCLQYAPVRTGPYHYTYAANATGCDGSSNNDILCNATNGLPIRTVAAGTTADITFEFTWREPIFATPFSSRMDETYGRPLFNITSMDLSFNLQDLTNMFRISGSYVTSYEVHITKCQLCYQVLTLPKNIVAPRYTVFPYRRFVPYITEYSQNPVPFGEYSTTDSIVNITSGVYTLNEIPTAIWVFLAPVKGLYQNNPEDGWQLDAATYPSMQHTWGYNKLFGQLRGISISMANTTQILQTAEPLDLYRIAKANGCQDSFTSWGRKMYNMSGEHGLHAFGGAGSVLRLIPGTDIVLPEQDLIPGANANNMVFQVSAQFNVPNTIPPNYRNMALWLLFEYVGVATLTNGQCTVEMNPLGNGSVMASAPVASAENATSPTAPAPTSTMEGSGWLDKVKGWLSKANQFAKKTGIISKALNYIPTVGPALSTAAKSLGYGYKRGRYDDDGDVEGGAIMGMGDFI